MFITRYRALMATLLGWRAHMWVSVKFKVLLLCASLKIGRRQLNSGAASLVFLVSLDCRNGACGQGSSIHGTRLSSHVVTEPRGALQSSASPQSSWELRICLPDPVWSPSLERHPHPCRSSKIVLIFEKFWHNKLCFFVSLLLLYL